MVLNRLLRERYVCGREADICEEHGTRMVRYEVLPHVRDWMNRGAPSPGPIATIAIHCPKMFLTMDYPDMFERN